MEQWLRWYRRGGLSEVLRRVVGHQAKGKKPYLNPLPQRALVAKVQLGQYGMQTSGSGDAGGCVILWACILLMKGLGLGLKVTRPHSDKALKTADGLEKRGLWMPWATGWNDYCLPVMALWGETFWSLGAGAAALGSEREEDYPADADRDHLVLAVGGGVNYLGVVPA